MFEIAPVAAIVNLKESIVAGSTVPVSVAPAQLNKKKFQPAFTAVASDCVVCAVGVQYLVVKSFPQIKVAEVKAETEPKYTGTIKSAISSQSSKSTLLVLFKIFIPSPEVARLNSIEALPESL